MPPPTLTCAQHQALKCPLVKLGEGQTSEPCWLGFWQVLSVTQIQTFDGAIDSMGYSSTTRDKPTAFPFCGRPDRPRSVPLTPGAIAFYQVAQGLNPESCPHTYNFHLHTTCSDGRLSPQAVIDQALAIGLQGLAITDHHSLAGYRQAQAYLETRQLETRQLATRQLATQQAMGESNSGSRLPRLWSGTEITARLLDTDVHILGYGFDPEATALAPYCAGYERNPTGEAFGAAAVIAALQEAGGWAVLAHPARYRQSPEELVPAAVALGIDGVESFYAYDNPSPWRVSPSQTLRVSGLAAAHNLMQTCGTDSHGLSLLQRL